MKTVMKHTYGIQEEAFRKMYNFTKCLKIKCKLKKLKSEKCNKKVKDRQSPPVK